MDLNRNPLAVILATLLCMTALQLPAVAAGLESTTPIGYQPSAEGYGYITEIPYQWQEINGFCHWAALSMALQHAGAPLDLHTLFAASGIGFSSSYLRYEDSLLMFAGAWFKQMEPLPIIAELYGLDIEVYIDSSGGFGALYSDALAAWSIGFTPLSGYNDALSLLKDTIDEGYPLVLWADPYHLPLRDYQIVRDLGLESAETGSGHAITVVGYNDTSETVMIQDPGAGAVEPEFGFPSDGRWFYEVNYTQLNSAWGALGYGTIVIQSAGGPSEDFQDMLVSYLLDRLRGARSSYAEGFENVFFWNFGADAFRGIALDLTQEGITSYLDEFDTDTETKRRILVATILMLEGSLGIQYLAFRKAVDTLPQLLPDLDLSQFTEQARTSYSHFEAIGDNATLVDYDYSGGNTILSETADNIAQAFDGINLDSVLGQYDNELDEVRTHLTAIADSWIAAADALEAAFHGSDVTVQLVIALGLITVIAVVILLYRRRSV